MICIKCGSDKLSTAYHVDEFAPKGCGYFKFNKRDREHLHKYCQNCGYDWCEDIYKPNITDAAKGRKE